MKKKTEPAAPTHIRDLIADPHNRRKHNPRNIGMVVDALQQVGASRSIVIDEDNVVLAGNGVTEAAAEAGITKLQVVDVDGETLVAVRRRGLTPEQKRSLAIYDNRAAELAEWNLEQLQADLGDGLDLAPWFSEEELALLFRKQTGAQGKTDPDDVPSPRPTDITRGDVFDLGPHRLLCGDCRSADLVAILHGDAKPRLIATDPPYCSGGFQEAGRSAGTWGDIASDTLSTRGYIALITKVLEASHAQTTYLCTDWRMWIPLYDVVESSGLAVRSMVVWDKGTPGLGALWRTQHELVMFASREKNARIKGLPAIGNVIQAKRSGNQLHYTEKPVDLFQQILQNDQSSERGKCDVYDPFAGSGTTMIACDQLARRCFAMEVEPKFCQVIIDRYEAFSGTTAVKVGEAVRT
jgi:DNA modification methylase